MKWISIKDYLPAYSKDVLTYGLSGFIVGHRHSTDVSGDNWKSSAGTIIINVTHWMPLVKPSNKK